MRTHFGDKTRTLDPNLFGLTTSRSTFRILDHPEFDDLEVYEKITVDNLRAWKFIGCVVDGRFEPAGITRDSEVVPRTLDPDSCDIHDLSSYLQYSDAEWALVTACVANKWAAVRTILQKWPWYRGTAIIEAVRATRTRMLAKILRDFPACQSAKYGKCASAAMRHNRALRLAVRRSLSEAVRLLIREPHVNVNTHSGLCLVTAVLQRDQRIFYELLASPQICAAAHANEALALAFRMRWEGDTPEIMYRSLLANHGVQDRGTECAIVYANVTVHDTVVMQRDMDTVRLHGPLAPLPSLERDLADQRMADNGTDDGQSSIDDSDSSGDSRDSDSDSDNANSSQESEVFDRSDTCSLIAYEEDEDEDIDVEIVLPPEVSNGGRI
jgi:hypothetical protein